MNIKSAIPNLITLGNLLCGFLSIAMVFYGDVWLAGFLVLLGALLDFFDGFAARLLKAQSAIGAQLDSLSDVVTFGLAPAFILFYMVMLHVDMVATARYLSDVLIGQGIMSEVVRDCRECVSTPPNLKPPPVSRFMSSGLTGEHWWYIVLCGLFPLFGAYRLARFNTLPPSDTFSGLPIPAAGLAVAALGLIMQTEVNNNRDMLADFFRPEYLITYALILAVLMVTKLPLFSLKFKSFEWKGNEIRYVFLLLSGGLIVMAAVLGNIWLAIPVSVMIYIFLSAFGRFG